jgi:malate dehydrogenase (oxaloacetate-decarboxylating)
MYASLFPLFTRAALTRKSSSQGTGAVTLACIMAAIGISSRSSKSGQGKRLSDQRYVILGAGSAGMGIAVQLRDAMVADDGVSRAEANRRFWLVDRQGLLYDSSTALLLLSQTDSADRREFIRPLSESWEELVEGEETIGLLEVVRRVKPTVLIGCSTAAGAFTEDVVKAMAAALQEEDPGARPIITPLSNPSRLVEATPENIIHWTGGRALVATGSPFDSVHMEKKEFT